MKCIYAALILVAGLGLIINFTKIAMLFWPNDVLLILIVGIAFVSMFFNWIRFYTESK
jgi:hypothetical protein